jgi:hypothetical protein
VIIAPTPIGILYVVTPADIRILYGETPSSTSMKYNINEGLLLYGGDHVNVVSDG